VLLPDPIYDAYQSPILLCGGRIRSVRSTIEHGRFALRPEAIEAAVTPTSRVLLLNTPWNPVGTVLREDELRAIADVVVRYNLVLISDEIYEAITYDGARHISPAVLSDELRARTIIINSLSKTYAMTGWRVGYCAAPASIIERMFLALQQSSRGPATFVQDAATTAITGPQDCVGRMRDEYAARRQLILTTLADVPGVRVLAPRRRFLRHARCAADGCALERDPTTAAQRQWCRRRPRSRLRTRWRRHAACVVWQRRRHPGPRLAQLRDGLRAL
jgi:aspartate aminotransferase